jgi:hypothetical protein
MACVRARLVVAATISILIFPSCRVELGTTAMTGTATGLSGDLAVEFALPNLRRSPGILSTRDAYENGLAARLAAALLRQPHR